MTDQRPTPCAGRCSTTFGDDVCRGCRRFHHEIIQWNIYSEKQQAIIWKRLDEQLDKILVPMLPHANIQHVENFLMHKRVRLLKQASKGRKLYQALKLCEKNRHLSIESGLGLQEKEVKNYWVKFESRILMLAQANYDVAWVRAKTIRKHRIEMIEI